MNTADGAADEAALVARAQGGDTRAFEALVARYQRLAVQAALGITGEVAEAEDAAQEAFVKAYVSMDRFRPDAPFRPWLMRIVANEARNRRTAAGRRAHLWERAAGAARDGVMGLFAPTAPPPEAAVLSAEERQALHEAIGRLREDERRVVDYRYFRDLSEAETAAALGWPRGTVKSRLSRAVSRLRVALPAALAVVLALLAGVLAASPRAREVVADRLGLRGVLIRHAPDVLEVPRPAPTALPGALPSGSAAAGTAAGLRVTLGEPATLASARARVTYPVLVPASPELGPADDVYVDGAVPGGQVWLVYRARTGFPVAGETGVSLLVSQFRGQLEHDVVFKGAGPGTRVEQLTVNGARGYWLVGDPHLVAFRDASGRMGFDQVRLAANVLLWEQAGLTLRLELAGTREQALRVASSMR